MEQSPVKRGTISEAKAMKIYRKVMRATRIHSFYRKLEPILVWSFLALMVGLLGYLVFRPADQVVSDGIMNVFLIFVGVLWLFDAVMRKVSKTKYSFDCYGEDDQKNYALFDSNDRLLYLFPPTANINPTIGRHYQPLMDDINVQAEVGRVVIDNRSVTLKVNCKWSVSGVLSAEDVILPYWLGHTKTEARDAILKSLVLAMGKKWEALGLKDNYLSYEEFANDLARLRQSQTEGDAYFNGDQFRVMSMELHLVPQPLVHHMI